MFVCDALTSMVIQSARWFPSFSGRQLHDPHLRRRLPGVRRLPLPLRPAARRAEAAPAHRRLRLRQGVAPQGSVNW